MPLDTLSDRRIVAPGDYGIDIASQRADELDLKALTWIEAQVARGRDVAALDVGCGRGGQAARMAQAGAFVIALDKEDCGSHVAAAMRETGVQNWIFSRYDARSAPWIGRFDLIICQRMIHYLHYGEALALLARLRRAAWIKGRLYLSASGLDSELGEAYPGRDIPVEERFAPLVAPMADKHAIRHPVCLYRGPELVEAVARAGWTVAECFASPFGNVKIVAAKGK